MACDEAFYRHFHKKQKHEHDHQHKDDHIHSHEQRDRVDQDSHPHQHEETLHAHPYQHDDPHHQPESLQIGISVYVLENRKEQLLMEDVDLLEFDDDRIVAHNILGKERSLSARLKRVHFVNHGKALMFLEKV